jgi:NADP-dependent 3-hydroxy acid dehydrogenase YdfG
LDDRVVAVTGASRGIGRTISEYLIGEGASVALLSRSAEPLEKLAAELGDRAIAVATDVGDPESVEHAFRAIDERFGRLDVLVNNAALAWPRFIEEFPPAELITQVNTNLLGPILTARSAIPLLRRSDDPHIINVSSDAAFEPFPLLIVYSATKAGLEVFTSGLRNELKPDDIRVTLLQTGRTEGSEFRNQWGDELQERALATWAELGIRARSAVGQPPERVAEAVVFIITRPKGTGVEQLLIRPNL